MAKRKQTVTIPTEASMAQSRLLGEVRAWPRGKKVKVVANDSWHGMPIGSIVEVVGEETDGSIMLNYLGKARWAAPSELADFA